MNIQFEKIRGDVSQGQANIPAHAPNLTRCKVYPFPSDIYIARDQPSVEPSRFEKIVTRIFLWSLVSFLGTLFWGVVIFLVFFASF